MRAIRGKIIYKQIICTFVFNIYHCLVHRLDGGLLYAIRRLIPYLYHSTDEIDVLCDTVYYPPNNLNKGATYSTKAVTVFAVAAFIPLLIVENLLTKVVMIL